jgi:16S rRNA (adenine1518-N6/adenine1519-N6)-dimethyltransferase
MDHRPRKRFSQNFLIDRHYVARIVEAIDPRPGDALVEIGPGRGALTRPLLERVARMTVLEIDRDLAAALEREYGDRLDIVVGDALEFDFARLGRSLRIVGNLPYHISSPLLFHCARFHSRLADLHFMLQAEVVDRMAASPDTPDYGRLSVTLQSLFDVRKLFRVPPGAFQPAPAVDSAVVRLVPLLPTAQPRIADRALFEDVVAAGFGQRRKTLRNALARLCGADTIAAAGIDPMARAETLSVGQFAGIANAIAASRATGVHPAGD